MYDVGGEYMREGGFLVVEELLSCKSVALMSYIFLELLIPAEEIQNRVRAHRTG